MLLFVPSSSPLRSLLLSYDLYPSTLTQQTTDTALSCSPRHQRLSLAMSGAVAIAAIEAFLYYRFFTRTEREKADMAKRKARGVAKRQAKTAATSLVAKKKQ
jgi:ADP-ribosylglycohydrolase